MHRIARSILGLITISCLAIAGCGGSGGCSDCGTGGSGATGATGGNAGSGGAGGNGAGTVIDLEAVPVISGLDHPWDIAWLPDDTVLVTERPGRLNVYVDGMNQPPVVIAPDDVVAGGEGGMLGLEVDPDFENNRYVYVCFCSDFDGPPDVRVVRFTLSTPIDNNPARANIVTGMPYNTSQTGRHSGCRPRFGPDDYLWVGTGDAAMGGTPQDDNSLGGKVLRVDRDGNPAPENPNGGLVFSKGHRNIQGMAFREAPELGMSVEHGPSVDDEVNLLVPGNFGWDPVFEDGMPGYNQPGTPMTDADKFPEAIEAAWATGSSTLALSGATFIEGSNWGNWNGVLAVAALREQHLHILFVDDEGKVTDGGRYLEDAERLRSPRMGPNDLLYITEDVRDGPSNVLRASPVFAPDN